MTPDERALLHAVAAAPADDTPRLVYADWLDDHGRPLRAEFIRLQCRIAEIETQPRHVVNLFSGLWRRQQEIFDEHPSELAGPLDKLKNVYMAFARGFVSEVTLHVRDFAANADMLASALPLPRVFVKNVAADPAALLESPALEVVTAIQVMDSDSVPFEAINGWPLAQAIPRLRRLDTLDLDGGGMSDVEGVVLLDTPLPALVDLDLANNGLTDAFIPLLLDSPLPRQLKRLILGGNPIGDQGAIELADRWPRTSPLESLNLRFTNIGQPGQAALLSRFGGKVDLF